MKTRFRAAVSALAVAALLAGCKPRKMDEETIAYAKAYVRFQNVRAGCKSDYRGQTLCTLHIDVANNGSRTIKEMDVVLYFYDTQGNVLVTERATAIPPRLRPLGPGQTRDFLHGFDLLDTWNRTSPSIGIAYLELR
jgi:hypothetical protein